MTTTRQKIPDPPTPEEAWQEAREAGWPKDRHAWSHPAVYLAGAEIGWFYVHVDRSGRHKERFVARYTRLVEQAQQGADLAARTRHVRDNRPRWLQRKEQALRDWESGWSDRLRAAVASSSKNTGHARRCQRTQIKMGQKRITAPFVRAFPYEAHRSFHDDVRAYSDPRTRALYELINPPADS